MKERNSINNQKGFFLIILGIAVLLVIVGAGVYYIGTRNTQTQELNTRPAISPQNDIASPTLTPIITQAQKDETANWKTYTSQQLPITFKYPPTMEATKLGGPGNRIPSGGYEFKEGGVWVKPLASRYEVYLRITTVINSGDSSYEWGVTDQLYNVSVGETPKTGRTEFIRKQDIILSGINAHVYENERSKYPTSTSKLMIMKKGDSYYIFEITVNLNIDLEEKERYFKTFDQILSTFKFSD